MTDILSSFLWGIAGGAVGMLLGWWQSRTIRKMEKKTPDHMMGRAYLSSVPRVLLISALLFLALRNNIWSGISFAIGYTVSRWIWTWLALRQLKREDK
jgi:NhaP-type Na+/H+ or K+/H+ antiporter